MRYVHGPGIDQPIVWYEGAGTANRRFLSSDERGSVISVTDGTGALVGINSYDEYGIPGAGNVGRFGYTGQAWLGEIGLQYSKARIYSPTLGRFLQTDPIGYEDGLNLYAYAANDPVNKIDPTGTDFVFWPVYACVGYSCGWIGYWTWEPDLATGVFDSGAEGRGEEPDWTFGQERARSRERRTSDQREEEEPDQGRDTSQTADNCNIIQDFSGAISLGLELGSDAFNAGSDLSYLATVSGFAPATKLGIALDVLSAGFDGLSILADVAAGNDVKQRIGISAVKLIPGSSAVKATLNLSRSDQFIANIAANVSDSRRSRKCGI